MRPSLMDFVLSTLLVFGLVVSAASFAFAGRVLVWEAEVLSSGGEVESSVLRDGAAYSVEVMGIWWYDFPNNLAADAQYYTTDPSDSWDWVNNFPAPDGHSFLQIDRNDVDWGAFSNGNTNHTYRVYIVGNGSSVTFRLVDWIDDDYANNDCRLTVQIYGDVTVGGYILDGSGATSLSFISVLLLSIVIALPLVGFRRSFRKNQNGS